MFYGSFGTNFYSDPFYTDLSAYGLDASDPFYTDPLSSELFLNDPFLGTPTGFESLFSDSSQFGIADFDRLGNYGIDDSGYDYSSFAPGGADSYFAIGADAGSPGVASLVGSNGAEKVRVAAYDSSAQGVRVATGDVDGDRVPDLITAPGPGSAPLVKVFSGSDGHLIKEFMAFEATFTGGVFVAAADLNQDGLVDIAITPDQGGGPRCKIVDGGSLGTMSDFLGIDDGFGHGGSLRKRTMLGLFRKGGGESRAFAGGR